MVGINRFKRLISWNGIDLLGGFLTMRKERGSGGIKVDRDNPQYTWADLLGRVAPKTSGAGTPVLREIRGGVFAYSVTTNDIIDFTFHLPHDYAPDTDIFGHTHLCHNGTAASGNLVLSYAVTYAKGHSQANFPAPITVTQTIPMAGYAQYEHVIYETQISAASPSASQMNTSIIEPDGLILSRMTVTGAPTITGGHAFILFSDIHYQSTSIGTINKSPNFWAL